MLLLIVYKLVIYLANIALIPFYSNNAKDNSLDNLLNS
jgi:hypothetical protein